MRRVLDSRPKIKPPKTASLMTIYANPIQSICVFGAYTLNNAEKRVGGTIELPKVFESQQAQYTQGADVYSYCG